MLTFGQRTRARPASVVDVLFGSAGSPFQAGADKPLRDELLSIERLGRTGEGPRRPLHGRSEPQALSTSVFPRFEQNARILSEAYRPWPTTCTGESS